MEGIANFIKSIGFINRLPVLKLKEKEVVDTGAVDLLKRIKETDTRLRAMRSAFECEVDFELIDIYILEIDALERQYSYLLRQAKAEHVVAQ